VTGDIQTWLQSQLVPHTGWMREATASSATRASAAPNVGVTACRVIALPERGALLAMGDVGHFDCKALQIERAGRSTLAYSIIEMGGPLDCKALQIKGWAGRAINKRGVGPRAQTINA
jgi:hypothetical protein